MVSLLNNNLFSGTNRVVLTPNWTNGMFSKDMLSSLPSYPLQVHLLIAHPTFLDIPKSFHMLQAKIVSFVENQDLSGAPDARSGTAPNLVRLTTGRGINRSALNHRPWRMPMGKWLNHSFTVFIPFESALQ